MPTPFEWEYVDRHVGQLAHLHQVVKLISHGVRTTHLAADHSLVQHRDEPDGVGLAGQQLLTGHPDGDLLIYVLCRGVLNGCRLDDRAGVRLGLQQTVMSWDSYVRTTDAAASKPM